jgi:molybdopterin-guanine dinucleotide biosynthesis protein A
MASPGKRLIVAGILCGGPSRRMGQDKARLAHPAGGTLIEHAVALAAAATPRVLLLSGDGGRYPETGLIELPDAEPGAGPLGGLVAGLRAADGAPLLLLPVDLPFLDAAALELLLDAQAAGKAPLTVAGEAGRLCPLPSIWDPVCWKPAEAALAAGRFALHALIARLPHQVIALPLPTLANWNAPEDLPRSAAPGA